VEVRDRITRANSTLTAAERRVAEVILSNEQLVAFGTVADLAEAATAGAATVVRLASKLGFDGFTALQASVQHDLGRQLRPAAERIREPSMGGSLQHHTDIEIANVQSTLGAIDPSVFDDVVLHLADLTSKVFVLSGDASRGVAAQFVGDLAALRDAVVLVDGNDVTVRRTVALMSDRDALLTLDLRRYDRWVIDAARAAATHGVWSVAVVDSVLSPLAEVAQRTLSVSAAANGPFDSHVGTLALLNALVAAVADRLREHATDRLAAVEDAWRAAGALSDR
jgi:DNA-binding MurR/RpiR family transcriptional regulator